MADSSLSWLQGWFASQCDDNWEHQNGIRIETLDNPGWALKVNLMFTPLEQRHFARVDERFRSDDDWVSCFVRDGNFCGFGGPANLIEIIEIFRGWAEAEPEGH